MKNGRNTAEILDNDDELDDIGPLDRECQEMRLILKKELPSWKAKLMAHGVKEIRCTHCGQIRPIDGAEESEAGWICEDCLPETMQEPKYGGQRGG
jgi:hypothetical protein